MMRIVIGRELIWLTLLLASSAASQSSASVVIENSFKAIGGRANAAKVDSIYSWAECTGPNGPYTTEISSARGGKILFTQKRQTGKAYFGLSDGRNAISGSDPAGETKAAGEREVFAWRSHDFARIAIDVEGFFSKFEAEADGTFEGRSAAILRAVDQLGNPARVYFEKRSGSMLGFTIRNPFAAEAEEIRTVFREWKSVDGLRLPSKVVVTDKQGDFVLSFTKITINNVDPRTFSVRRGDTAMTANMALIPGATFEMGQDAADVPKLMKTFGVDRAELFQDETPRHRVTIGSFYMDRTEVTNSEFRRFIEQNPEWQKGKIAAALHNGKYLQQWNGNEFPAGQANHPVVFVSWYAAAAYCTSQGKRLPTEAEWEYAARGGLEGKTFPWGDEMPDKTRANYGESGFGAAIEVGKYPANGYGLYDMAGNVWEYLADEWSKYPLAQNDPDAIFRTGGLNAVKTRRALRGGSYGGGTVNMRVTYRDSHAPENAGDHVGFRCAMTSPVQSAAVNELLRIHYADRAAHFGRDAASMVARFSDDHASVSRGRVSSQTREANRTRMQAYFDASTSIEWDDIAPPIIRVSDDASMAYAIVQKRVRLRAKNAAGGEEEQVEIFAWLSTYQKIGGQWKLTTIASTNTPEDDK